jgi:hypothetical protein
MTLPLAIPVTDGLGPRVIPGVSVVRVFPSQRVHIEQQQPIWRRIRIGHVPVITADHKDLPLSRTHATLASWY